MSLTVAMLPGGVTGCSPSWTERSRWSNSGTRPRGYPESMHLAVPRLATRTRYAPWPSPSLVSRVKCSAESEHAAGRDDASTGLARVRQPDNRTAAPKEPGPAPRRAVLPMKHAALGPVCTRSQSDHVTKMANVRSRPRDPVAIHDR
jgi:hypothetical protein